MRYASKGMGQESTRRPRLETDTTAPRRAAESSEEEHEAFNALVGEGIRRARQERSWTQAFLAEQARLSPNYIARLERGELGPSLFVANRICLALRMEIGALLAPPSSGTVTPRRPAKRRASS